MDHVARRAFMQGAGIGALAFTVGSVEVLLTAAQARAQGVQLRRGSKQRRLTTA